MKVIIFLALSDFCGVFISHMVQMKEKMGKFDILGIMQLYIPHGSDERMCFASVSSPCLHFISHMVQMKGKGLVLPLKGQ